MKKILILVIVIFLASCTQENVKARMTVSYELREKALIFSDTKMGQYGLIETIYDSKNYSYGQYGTVFDIEHIYLDSLLKYSEMKNDLYNLRLQQLQSTDKEQTCHLLIKITVAHLVLLETVFILEMMTKVM